MWHQKLRHPFNFFNAHSNRFSSLKRSLLLLVVMVMLPMMDAMVGLFNWPHSSRIFCYIIIKHAWKNLRGGRCQTLKATTSFVKLCRGKKQPEPEPLSGFVGLFMWENYVNWFENYSKICLLVSWLWLMLPFRV